MANGSAAAFSAVTPAERAQRMANASTAASNAGTAAEHACREESTPLSELLSDESDSLVRQTKPQRGIVVLR